jgi:hypothetical protein
MEALARRTMRQASGYAWMYEHTASDTKRWSDAMSIISGTLGGVVGTAGVVDLLTSPSSTPTWSHVIQVVVGFLIGFIAVLNATWRLNDAYTGDILSQVSYAMISQDLMCQLTLPRRDRQDAREYLGRKTGEIEQLKLSAPPIGRGARRAYNEKFRNNPIYSLADGLEPSPAEARPPSEGLPSGSSSSDGSSSGDGGSPPGGRPAPSRSDSPAPLALMGTLVDAYAEASESRASRASPGASPGASPRARSPSPRPVDGEPPDAPSRISGRRKKKKARRVLPGGGGARQ